MNRSVTPLPTMQHNALRLLLRKRDFVPSEIARLDWRQLERAPRIGRKGIEVIRAWLRQYGLDLSPAAELSARAEVAPARENEDDADALAVLNRLIHQAEVRRNRHRPVAAPLAA